MDSITSIWDTLIGDKVATTEMVLLMYGQVLFSPDSQHIVSGSHAGKKKSVQI